MTQKTNAAAKGLTTKHVILILGALIIICAAIVTAIFLLRDKPEASNPVINESNLEDIQGQVQDKVAKGMFLTHMNTTWTFPNGKANSSDAVMGNAKGNNYPFWFTVTLSDTGEQIFQSGMMPVGTQLSEIKLDKDLDQGVYPALVNIHMVEENGTEVESNMGFNISLVVEN